MLIYKIPEIISNFWESANTLEKIEVLGPPLLITLGIYALEFATPADYQKFIAGFTNTLLTISSLLIAFEVASITILMTSPSKNIEFAKKTPTKRKTVKGYGISYYQLILIRNFYTTIVLMFLIFVGLLFNLIINIMPQEYQKIILGFEIFLLTHAMVVLGLVLSHMYYLLWKDKLSKEDILSNDKAD